MSLVKIEKISAESFQVEGKLPKSSAILTVIQRNYSKTDLGAVRTSCCVTGNISRKRIEDLKNPPVVFIDGLDYIITPWGVLSWDVSDKGDVVNPRIVGEEISSMVMSFYRNLKYSKRKSYTSRHLFA